MLVKDVVKLKPLCKASENGKWSSSLENGMAISQKN
jgi:hypothetical protein